MEDHKWRSIVVDMAVSVGATVLAGLTTATVLALVLSAPAVVASLQLAGFASADGGTDP